MKPLVFEYVEIILLNKSLFSQPLLDCIFLRRAPVHDASATHCQIHNTSLASLFEIKLRVIYAQSNVLL